MAKKLDKDGNLKLPEESAVVMPEETKPEVGALKP